MLQNQWVVRFGGVQCKVLFFFLFLLHLHLHHAFFTNLNLLFFYLFSSPELRLTVVYAKQLLGPISLSLFPPSRSRQFVAPLSKPNFALASQKDGEREREDRTHTYPIWVMWAIRGNSFLHTIAFLPSFSLPCNMIQFITRTIIKMSFHPIYAPKVQAWLPSSCIHLR